MIFLVCSCRNNHDLSASSFDSRMLLQKEKWQQRGLLFSLTHLNKGLSELVTSMILVETGQSWDGDGIRQEGLSQVPTND